MADDRIYYVFCEDNCRFESMTKSQILTAIRKAINAGVVDINNSADGIKDMNKGGSIRFWIGTQAEYNAIEEIETNVLYIISDDNSKEELLQAIEDLNAKVLLLANQIAENGSSISAAEILIREQQDTAIEISQKLEETEASVTELSETVEEQETRIEAAEALADKITDKTAVELFHSNVSVRIEEGRIITLSEAAANFSKIILNFINTNAGSANVIIYPAYVGEDDFSVWFEWVTYRGESFHTETQVFLFRFEETKLICDYSLESLTVNEFTVYGIY